MEVQRVELDARALELSQLLPRDALQTQTLVRPRLVLCVKVVANKQHPAIEAGALLHVTRRRGEYDVRLRRGRGVTRPEFVNARAAGGGRAGLACELPVAAMATSRPPNLISFPNLRRAAAPAA